MFVTEERGLDYLDFMVSIEQYGQSKKISHIHGDLEVQMKDIMDVLDKIAKQTGHGGVSAYG